MEDSDFQYLELTGPIGLNRSGGLQDESEILNTIIDYLDVGRGLIIKLDSLGGYLSQYSAMKDFIDHARQIKSENVFTVIEKNKKCASMCVVFFLLSPKRIIHSSARIGLHAVSLNGMPISIITRKYLDWLNELGVENQWIEENSSIFKSFEIHWYSPNMLIHEKSGIVTEDQIL